MSKSIIIQEGGTGKQISADKLETNLSSSGTCLWVPADDVALTTKSINEDGTYKARDDGYYGFSEVTVSGCGRAVGKGSDGNVHVYEEDGEGNVTDVIIPEEIRITVMPSVLDYVDGQAITLNGIVVTAYNGDGTVWEDSSHSGGLIPISELTYTPTVAAYDPAHADGQKEAEGITVSYDTGTTVETSIETGGATQYRRLSVRSGSGPFYIFGIHVAATDLVGAVICSPNSFNFKNEREDGYSWTGSAGEYTHAGQKVYRMQATLWKMSDGASVSAPINNIADFSDYDMLAWICAYGEPIHDPGTTIVPVEITWPRPGDGQILQTDFEINVTEATT